MRQAAKVRFYHYLFVELSIRLISPISCIRLSQLPEWMVDTLVLEVFLWGKTDAEVKYACVEMLNHLGLSCRIIWDARSLKNKERNAVLILPEASMLGEEELVLLLESPCSLIFVNHLPEMLLSKLGVRMIGSKRVYPPEISGVLKVDGFDHAPFFYDFPIIESETGLFERVGEIGVEGVDYAGVMTSKGDSKSFVIIVPQIFRSAAYMLSGGEETLFLSNSERAQLVDGFDRIDVRKTEIGKCGFLGVPIVNVYEELLLRLLLDLSERKGTLLMRKWLFPRNYDAALCVTHDAENVISAESGKDAIYNFLDGKLVEGLAKYFLGSIAVASTLLVHLRIFKSRQSLRLVPLFLSGKLRRFNPVWNFDKLLDTDKRFGIVSSFYFLANEGKMDSDYDFGHPLIKEAMSLVMKKGCNVGLHASFGSYLDKGQLRREKDKLEEALGSKVRGVRQHYYRFEAPNTWRRQEEAGFSFDSSFGYAQQVGFRAGVCLPFRPFDCRSKKAFSILEFPCLIEDGVLLQNQYMALSSGKAFKVCGNLVDATVRHHGVITLAWHESVDRERAQDWFVLYERILQYCSKFNLWKTTVEDLATRFDTLRAIVIEKLSTSKNSFDIEITSPNSVEDFTLKVHLPSNGRIQRIFVNQVEMDHWKSRTDGTVDVCLNIEKGKNSLKIFFSRET